jgi:hypothetical protein
VVRGKIRDGPGHVRSYGQFTTRPHVRSGTKFSPGIVSGTKLEHTCTVRTVVL